MGIVITIFISLCFIALLLGIAFLLQRVTRLEGKARELASANAQGVGASSKDPVFDQNDGEQLWKVLSETSRQYDEKTLEDARQRYAFVMIKHATSLFEMGKRDESYGSQQTPSNTKRVNMLRGGVMSWMPEELAVTLYECGRHALNASDESERASIRAALSTVCKTLSQQLQLNADLQLAERLIPREESAESEYEETAENPMA